MADINSDIAAYDAMRGELESDHTGKWVLFHERQLISIYPSFEAAAEEAVKQFGRGPYLIRQVGAPPLVLPASVMYHLLNA
jgi:hypothetical protein